LAKLGVAFGSPMVIVVVPVVPLVVAGLVLVVLAEDVEDALLHAETSADATMIPAIPATILAELVCTGAQFMRLHLPLLMSRSPRLPAVFTMMDLL
jgi:hypothetical protein